MDNSIFLVLGAGLTALFILSGRLAGLSQDQGTDRMKINKASISEGAMSFLKAEYRVLIVLSWRFLFFRLS